MIVYSQYLSKLLMPSVRVPSIIFLCLPCYIFLSSWSSCNSFHNFSSFLLEPGFLLLTMFLSAYIWGFHAFTIYNSTFPRSFSETLFLHPRSTISTQDPVFREWLMLFITWFKRKYLIGPQSKSSCQFCHFIFLRQQEF